MPTDETFAWVDLRTGPKGYTSREHRLDPLMTEAYKGRLTGVCGTVAPAGLERRTFTYCFRITAEESTGQCIRCFPYTCRHCRRRRGEICCSSHKVRLCHGCYRRSHFVEVCAEGCSQCEAEGLPRIFIRTREEALGAGT